jgi:hypothetical protein
MRSIKGAIALLLLTCIILALTASVFSYGASAHADFATYADRNTRPTEPIGYDVNGTSVKTMVDWPGTRGVGNLGIGNGDISLMDPDVINRAVRNASAGQNVSTAIPAGNETQGEDQDATGWGFQASDTEAAAEGGGDAGEAGDAEEVEEAWESLLPRHVAAASIITRGEPYSITINEPYPHILNENPVEPGVLYAKMLGLQLPGGRMIDMGIKSLGTEF